MYVSLFFSEIAFSRLSKLPKVLPIRIWRADFIATPQCGGRCTQSRGIFSRYEGVEMVFKTGVQLVYAPSISRRIQSVIDFPTQQLNIFCKISSKLHAETCSTVHKTKALADIKQYMWFYDSCLQIGSPPRTSFHQGKEPLFCFPMLTERLQVILGSGFPLAVHSRVMVEPFRTTNFPSTGWG